MSREDAVKVIYLLWKLDLINSNQGIAIWDWSGPYE